MMKNIRNFCVIAHLVGRNATDSEAGTIVEVENVGAYSALLQDEFKQKFTRFALANPTASGSAFMTVPEITYSTLLYHYMLGYPLTDTSQPLRSLNARAYHRLVDYAFYRSHYTGYDPLEVFSDVCD